MFRTLTLKPHVFPTLIYKWCFFQAWSSFLLEQAGGLDLPWRKHKGPFKVHSFWIPVNSHSVLFQSPMLYLEPSLLSSFYDSLRIFIITCIPWVLYIIFFDLSVNTQRRLKTQLSAFSPYSYWQCEIKDVFPNPLMNPQYVSAVVFHPASVSLRLSQWVHVGGGKQVFPWLITAFSS